MSDQTSFKNKYLKHTQFLEITLRKLSTPSKIAIIIKNKWKIAGVREDMGLL